jgi:ribosomal protein S18 acetylase RimI-like enzyme
LVRVRPAEANDAAAIAAIGQVAFPPTYQGVVPSGVIEFVVGELYTERAVAASIDELRRHPNSWFLVAEVDGELAGFLHYDERGPEPELHRIYLRPDAIGSGVGTNLIEALHASLPAEAQYVLLVVTQNARAIAFYQRHGLVIRETVDAISYYRANMHVDIPPHAPHAPAYVMERRAKLNPGNGG